LKIKILDVAIEHVKNGKKQYSKAQVAYSHEGQARTQNIISFANPSIFAKVQEKVGQEVEVTITKNAAGYNEWASLDDVDTSNPAPTATSVSSTPNAARPAGSTYETAAERAAKQVYIVKQSSISAAVALAGHNEEPTTPQQIIETAQLFVDYVFKD
jgi:hypothetical protein